MTLRGFHAVAVCVLVATWMPATHAADTAREMHGSADAFALPGMALAWGVLRGASEAATTVVVRIKVDPREFAEVEVGSSDPFTQSRRSILARAPANGLVEVRLPRAHFAEFPRTELRFYPAASATADKAAPLVVFYLGVPDTTPEFTDESRLDAYLRDRNAQLTAKQRQ